MNGKILLVDDDKAIRGFLSTLLKQAGYEVIETDSLREGKHALEKALPDLLIADVRLGAFNGMQLIAASDRPIPAIVLTGFADPVLEAEAKQLGARFLLKPIKSAALLTLVEELLPAARRDSGSRPPAC